MKAKLMMEKKKALLEYLGVKDDDDVEIPFLLNRRATKRNYLFYHHLSGRTNKYYVFTLGELREYLINHANHEENIYDVDMLCKVTSIPTNKIENFALASFIVSKKNVSVGTYHLLDGSTKTIYRLHGVAVNELIRETMSVEDFVSKYVEHLIKENLTHYLLPCWSNTSNGEFYFFNVE